MEVCIYHINISPNHPYSHFFLLIKMFPCQTLLWDLFLLQPFSTSSSLFLITLPLSFFHRVSHHSFCCHSTLVIRLSVLIKVLLMIVRQTIIQTFHYIEVEV